MEFKRKCPLAGPLPLIFSSPKKSPSLPLMGKRGTVIFRLEEPGKDRKIYGFFPEPCPLYPVFYSIS
jgi:hypothetical protein